MIRSNAPTRLVAQLRGIAATNPNPAASGRKRLIKMFNQDRLASQLTHSDQFDIEGQCAQLTMDTVTKHGFLTCPWPPCTCGGKTHVVDVVWERDPREQDRRWVRMEVRCEDGHGYLLLIRNHAGVTYFDVVLLDDSIVSPFAEGARW